MATDSSNNCPVSSDEELTDNEQPVDMSNNIVVIDNPLNRFITSKGPIRKINRTITDIINDITKDIENMKKYEFGKTPIFSKENMINHKKFHLDNSKENKNTIIKRDNENINHHIKKFMINVPPKSVVQRSRYRATQLRKRQGRLNWPVTTRITRDIATKSHNKDNQNNIKHIERNIDMKIQDLIQKIKSEQQHLEDTKNNNKQYINLSRDLDEMTGINSNKSNNNDTRIAKTNHFSSLPPPKNIIVTRPPSITRRRLDSLTNHIENSYFQKYNNPLFHGNSIFTNKEDFPLFLKDESNQILRSHLQPKVPRPPSHVEKKKVNIEVEIESLDDLLKLIEDYPIQYDIEYNINMEAMHNIKDPLLELKHMIGMNKLKDSIVDQIIYFIQDLHQSNVDDGDFMHTCIYGPPGTGKTEVAKIMGKIYSKLGVLKRNVFKKVTRADLIAGYLGQTSLKTRDIIKDCLGGVMFIDEAYALGNSEKRDSFAKECIDTLCEALSNHKHDLMVIIAGYEEELKKCFFSYNQGLDSRFTWRFKTDDYTPSELRQIFIKKVNDAEWTIEKDSVQDNWFEKNNEYFKFFGRDMETLFSKVKIAHSRRVFCLAKDKKRCINDKDLEKGFSSYLDNDEVKNRKDDFLNNAMHAMYV